MSRLDIFDTCLEMVKAMKAAKPVDLIDFLHLAAESFIEVYVFGTDAVSGARGFATQTFSVHEICPGEFLPDSFEQTGQFEASSTSTTSSS